MTSGFHAAEGATIFRSAELSEWHFDANDNSFCNVVMYCAALLVKEHGD